MTSEFITLARVLKTQGRHGEVAVEVHSDVPNRFRERMHLWSLAEDGSRRELEIEDLWPHKGQLILKFVGIDSISKAEELAGRSEEHTSELQSRPHLVCRLLLEKKTIIVRRYR